MQVKSFVNMHKIERVSMFMTGAFICSLIFWGPEKIRYIVGIIPMIVGYTGSNPLYRKIGITTVSGKIERTNKRSC
jgi:hypothetical protein